MQDKGGGGGSTGEKGGFSIPAMQFPQTDHKEAATALKDAYLTIWFYIDWVTVNFSLCGTNRIKHSL